MNLEIWRTVKGNMKLKTAIDFVRALEKGGFLIGSWAKDLLLDRDFKVSGEEKQDLVVLTTAELVGKKQGGTTIEVFVGGKDKNLFPCDHEIGGPLLRLQYEDQPIGESLLIAMEPLRDMGENPSVFKVENHDSKLWLNADKGDPHFFWPGDSRWVFWLHPTLNN